MACLSRRTTLDSEDDVLAATQELARRHGTSAGAMVSRQLRAALSGSNTSATPPPAPARGVAGFCPFPAQGGQLVTNDTIDQLRDEAGLGRRAPCSIRGMCCIGRPPSGWSTNRSTPGRRLRRPQPCLLA